jgi:hypothetical protein
MNGTEWHAHRPEEPDVYVNSAPEQLSQVEVLEPDCPFDVIEDVAELDEYLRGLPFYRELDEVSKTELWRLGLAKCAKIIGRE